MSTWRWRSAPLTGLLAGTAGGLAQDALAGGIVGIGGLAKTMVGFFVGVLGAQFIVSQPLPRFVMFVGATFVHELCFQASTRWSSRAPSRCSIRAVLVQALVNAVIGVLAFQVVEGTPGLLQRRQSRGGMFGRSRY